MILEDIEDFWEILEAKEDHGGSLRMMGTFARSLKMMRRPPNSSLAEADTISGVLTGETVLTTLPRFTDPIALTMRTLGDP